jgi:hypothetical protein
MNAYAAIEAYQDAEDESNAVTQTNSEIYFQHVMRGGDLIVSGKAFNLKKAGDHFLGRGSIAQFDSFTKILAEAQIATLAKKLNAEELLIKISSLTSFLAPQVSAFIDSNYALISVVESRGKL